MKARKGNKGKALTHVKVSAGEFSVLARGWQFVDPQLAEGWWGIAISEL